MITPQCLPTSMLIRTENSIGKVNEMIYGLCQLERSIDLCRTEISVQPSAESYGIAHLGLRSESVVCADTDSLTLLCTALTLVLTHIACVCPLPWY